MGLDHREFFRLLPAALAGYRHHTTPTSIAVELDDADSRLTIDLGPVGERRIALLRIPTTKVTFSFENCSAEATKAFLARFEGHYRRGGG